MCESGEVSDIVRHDRTNLSRVSPLWFGLHNGLGTMALEIWMGMNSQCSRDLVHIKALARLRVLAHQRVSGTVPRGIWNSGDHHYGMCS